VGIHVNGFVGGIMKVFEGVKMLLKGSSLLSLIENGAWESHGGRVCFLCFINIISDERLVFLGWGLELVAFYGVVIKDLPSPLPKLEVLYF
jgi:hypothetical protein